MRDLLQRREADKQESVETVMDGLDARSLQDPLHRARSLSADGVAQRRAGPGGPAVSIPSGGGSALEGGVRQRMESGFGTDFSDVRVHTGPAAASVGALAFTQGSNVHFAPGQYSEHTLAHELAHVVQQRAGRVQPTGSVNGVALNDDPGLESEADRMADAVTRG